MATSPIRSAVVPRRSGRTLQSCPLCASTELSYEFIVDGQPVCRCERCTLLFINPQPSRVAGRETAAAAEPMEVSVYDLHASNAAERLDQLAAYAGHAPHRLLMVANDPFLTEEARRRQWDVVSLSVDDLEQGGLSSLPDGTFDAAVFYCTLERLADPEGALRALGRSLTPDAAVMVIAPTIDSRTARIFRSAWWEFHARNLHYFTADTLQSLLIKSGYGDPIIHNDESAVSLEYFRGKIPAISSRFYRRVISVLLALLPPFVRHRAFRSLTSRRVIFSRRKAPRPVPVLSVIVPAFNEKATLSTIMDRLIEKSIEGMTIEIVLVESNSTDGTRDVAQHYGQHPRVTLILQDSPRGKGFAVRSGLAACTGDIVLFQDADLEYDIGDYDDLVAPLLAHRYNFVIGSRHAAKGQVWKIRQFNDSAPLAAFFNLGHVIFLTLFNLIYRQRMRDPFSMFKVFRRDCIYGLPFECNRFDFDFEIVIKLLRKGYRPLELPVMGLTIVPAQTKVRAGSRKRFMGHSPSTRSMSQKWSQKYSVHHRRFSVRRQGFLVETGVPARMHKTCEQLRVVAMPRGFVEQPHDRTTGLAGVGFEIGVELVRDRQLRIQFERAVVRLPGPFHAVGRCLDVLADEAIASAQASPGRRVAWIERDAALVQVARLHRAAQAAADLVAAQIQLVRAGAGRRIWRRRRGRAAQWQRQRLDHATREVVLELEEIAERRLNRM